MNHRYGCFHNDFLHYFNEGLHLSVICYITSKFCLQDAEEQLQSQPGRPANYRSKTVRKEQCKAMREQRWSDKVRNEISLGNTADNVPEGPTLRSSLPYTKAVNMDQCYVVNLEMLTTALSECVNCKQGPLDLRNSFNVRPEGVCPVLKVKCTQCEFINIVRPAEHHRTGKRGPPTFDANSRAGLGALHCGLGHTHTSGFLTTLGVPSISSSNFKKRERESGKAVEEVAKDSCNQFNEEEKRLSTTGNEEVVKLGVSYDMGWRKRGRCHDSSSGVGTAVGLHTGKVISYATRNKMCRVCDEAEKKNKEAESHDCRKNHEGSSKSMEANVAVELFSSAPKSGVIYSTYVGDDDSVTENHLKTLVNYDIDKWSDVNHASRTLGTRLYMAIGKIKGLTPNVISYIQKSFTYCVNQNKGQPSSLLEGLTSIVPHAFGKHDNCSNSWCGYKKDPEGYKHGSLPGGKDLTGEDLRATLEEAIRPFLSHDSVKKLAPAGSSQRNESVNSSIGSKAPKIRHYGGSQSSDFRTAAGIAQFNKGNRYLTLATEKMGLAQTHITEQNTDKIDKKRKRDGERKSTKEFKKARRNSRKKKNQKTNSAEKRESATYETGIGWQQSDKEKAAITNATMNDLKACLTKEEFNDYTDDLPKSNEGNSQEVSELPVIQQRSRFLHLALDIETTGLDRKSDILQISCIPPNAETKSFSVNLFPENRIIGQSATQVHGISVEFCKGRKTLLRRGKELEAVSQTQGLSDFCSFLKQQSRSFQVVLIAHNGEKFDFPVLINALRRNNLLELFLATGVVLVDSLKIVSTEMKQKGSPLYSCKSKSLSDVYEVLLKEKFDAHDAQEDATALSRILFQSPLQVSVERIQTHAVPAELFVKKMNSAQEAKSRKSTLHRLPVSEGMKEKMGKAGLDYETMQGVYKKGGTKALLAVLALPESFEQIQEKRSKPRVTKNLNILTAVVNYFVRMQS